VERFTISLDDRLAREFDALTAEQLTRLHQAHHDLKLSTLHGHLDHDPCLATVVLHGSTSAMQGGASAPRAQRGVRHGKLNLIGVDAHLAHRHPRDAAADAPDPAGPVPARRVPLKLSH
jgi:CopG family nickel-responsive transcriptional regulator